MRRQQQINQLHGSSTIVISFNQELEADDFVEGDQVAGTTLNTAYDTVRFSNSTRYRLHRLLLQPMQRFGFRYTRRHEIWRPITARAPEDVQTTAVPRITNKATSDINVQEVAAERDFDVPE